MIALVLAYLAAVAFIWAVVHVGARRDPESWDD